MSAGKMCLVHKAAWVLVLVGALNWGLVGGFGFNLVNTVVGSMPMVEKVVYIVVGLSAVAMLFTGKCKKCCEGGNCSCGSGEKKM